MTRCVHLILIVRKLICFALTYLFIYYYYYLFEALMSLLISFWRPVGLFLLD